MGLSDRMSKRGMKTPEEKAEKKVQAEETPKAKVISEEVVEKKAPEEQKARLKFGAEEYETEVDELLELVNNSKHILLKDAADKLGMTMQKAEEWAEVLNKHKLVEIYYPPVGPIELRALDYAPGANQKKGFFARIFSR